MKNLIDFGRLFFSKVFVRYLVAALFGAACDYATFIWLYGVTVDIFVSNLVGFLMGTTVNFFICRHYVFKEKAKDIKAIFRLYAMTYLVVLIATFYIQYTVSLVGIQAAKISSFGISYVLNFAIRKFFVFSKENHDK